MFTHREQKNEKQKQYREQHKKTTTNKILRERHKKRM